VIDLLAVPVHATCLARADGAAIGVLAVADRRAAAPHAQLRFDAPSTTVAGRVGDLVTAADDLRRCRDAFCTRVARAAGQTPGWIDAALRERRTFEPVEAVRAGLIDEI